MPTVVTISFDPVVRLTDAASVRWEFLPNSFAHLPWLAIPALLGVALATAWAVKVGGAPR